MISERPAEAEDRAVPGHHCRQGIASRCPERGEGDLILGLNASAMGTPVERTTRFTMLLHLPPMPGHRNGPRARNGPALAGRGAEAVRDAIAAAITTMPAQLRRSLTWDQGAEMARHSELRIKHDLPVYFCDPQSPPPGTSLRNALTGQCVAAGHEREHQWPAASVLSQRHRPRASWTRRTRGRRRRSQWQATKNPRMENTCGGSGRATGCPAN